MRTNSLLGNFEELEASINPKEEIKQFIEDNYQTTGRLKISKEPNKDGRYIVDCIEVIVKNENITSLTNNIFKWGVIKKRFYCSWCTSLKSLEGAPEEVGESFSCSECRSLKTLEGAPKKVGGSFSCTYCDSLKSLEGAPEEVGEGFSCYNCKSLTSLEGAPKKVGGNFKCWGCKSLTSLKGAPEEIGEYFDCARCGKQFTKEDIKKVCNMFLA